MEQSKFYKERQWANGKSSIVPTPRRELAFYLWISDDWLNKTHSRKMRELKAQSWFHQYQVIILDYLVRNLSKPIEKGYIKVNNGKKNYKSQTVEAIKIGRNMKLILPKQLKLSKKNPKFKTIFLDLD